MAIEFTRFNADYAVRLRRPREQVNARSILIAGSFCQQGNRWKMAAQWVFLNRPEWFFRVEHTHIHPNWAATSHARFLKIEIYEEFFAECSTVLSSLDASLPPKSDYSSSLLPLACAGGAGLCAIGGYDLASQAIAAGHPAGPRHGYRVWTP